MIFLYNNHEKMKNNKIYSCNLSSYVLFFIIIAICFIYLHTIKGLFFIQTGDEKWFRNNSLHEITRVWINDNGYYRILGIYLLDFFIEFIPSDVNKIFLSAIIFFSCLIGLIKSILYFLDISNKFDIWIYLLVLSTPFWIPTITQPVRLILDCNAFLFSFLFLILFKKYKNIYVRIAVFAFYLTFSALTYESCVALIVLIVIIKGEFKIANVLISIGLVVALFLAVNPNWKDPKIFKSLGRDDLNSKLISLSDIVSYFTNKIYYLFQPEFEIILYVIILSTFLILIYINFYYKNCVIEIQNGKMLLLLFGGIAIPITFILLMNLKTESISIPWTIYFGSIIVFSIGLNGLLINKKIYYIIFIVLTSTLCINFINTLRIASINYGKCNIPVIENTLYSNLFKEHGYEKCIIK